MQIYEEPDIRATIKSWLLDLEQILLGNKEPERIIEWLLLRLELDFQPRGPRALQLAQQLRGIGEALKQAQTFLAREETEEEAYASIQTALTLMRQLLAEEDEEKIAATQIDLQLHAEGAPAHASCPGRDAWEEANQHLHTWSTLENEGKTVDFTIRYEDGHEEKGSFTLPLLLGIYQEKHRLEPRPHLGKWIIDALKERLEAPYEDRQSFEIARQAVMKYLRRYEVGGPAYRKGTTKAILYVQDADYFRFSLDSKRVAFPFKPEKMLSFEEARMIPVQAAYMPYGELWAYRLYLEGVYDVRVTKRFLAGQTMDLQSVGHHTTARQTRLDFSVLPGDEDPDIEKAGETVQIEVLRGKDVAASIIFHREGDESLTVETQGCDLFFCVR